MNEINRNTRTLVVSFVVAIMVLIPLRFVEVGQTVGNNDEVQVLGETTVSQEAVPTAVLEEPYKTIENQKSCVIKADIDSAWAELKAEVESGQIDQEQAADMVAQLVSVEKDSCK